MASIPGIDLSELQPTPRYLFRQPVALQWFENGKLIKRHEEERQAGKHVYIFAS